MFQMMSFSGSWADRWMKRLIMASKSPAEYLRWILLHKVGAENRNFCHLEETEVSSISASG